MSRTYRKNPRCYRKHQGVIYNTYDDITIKGKAKNFERISSYDTYTSPIWSSGRYRCEVLVSDSENCIMSPPSGWKEMCNRIDRKRYKVALRENEDAYIKSSYNPWDWD
ncbi:MAG: hypothetical protein WC119_00740 [Synergistaceae bacterium]